MTNYLTKPGSVKLNITFLDYLDDPFLSVAHSGNFWPFRAPKVRKMKFYKR